MESYLDWIFKAGFNCLAMDNNFKIVNELAECLDYSPNDLWSSSGEMFFYVQSGYNILMMAKPYLENHDKEGWLKFCAEYKDKKK